MLIHEFIQGEAAGAAAFDPTRAEPPTIEMQAGKEEAIEKGRARVIEEAVRARRRPTAPSSSSGW